MDYRKLGSSGLEVSAVGLGTNNFGRRLDYEGTERVVKAAIEHGITFIDTANIYSAGQSEEHIGRAVKGERDKVILATKAGGGMYETPNGRGNSRKHILSEIDASLKRLQTDYIDLFQIHFPDPRTPLEETLRALDDAVRQGKVLYVGCSNFPAWMIAEGMWISRSMGLAPFVSVQPEYNLLNRAPEQEVIPVSQRYNLGVIPYYPLASGFLTGKYRPGEELPAGTRLAGMPAGPFRDRFLNERNYATLGVLESFAQDHGHTIGELAIAWLLARPQVASVIAGAMRPEQVAANAKAAEWQLTKDDMADLEKRLTQAD